MTKTAYYTIEQIAERLCCPKRRIPRYIKTFGLPAVKIGRDWFITEKCLQKWEDDLQYQKGRVNSI